MNSFESFPRPQPFLCAMPEEDESSSASQGGDAPSEWSFHEAPGSVLSTSPSTSLRSGQSSPSEIGGDSGVCSEHDTPPPVVRKQVLAPPKVPAVSSDSDNDSSESVADLEKDLSSPLPQDADLRPKAKKKTCRVVAAQKKVPDCLLREIKEKWRVLKKRRQAQKGSDGTTAPGSAFVRTSSFQRSARVSRLTSPSFSTFSSDLSSLSLADSSNYSSMTSLATTEEEDYFPCTSGSDYYRKPLFECRDESAAIGFAGLHDIFAPQQEATIKSSKGTVRGVKNRVRAGIATFTSDHRFLKLFAEREKGKVVIYVTTLGVVRDTYERCLRLRKILWTLLVHFEERDIFMSRDNQIQLLDRLHARNVSVPHVFLEGQYLGSVELIEKLNENGELRKLLQSYMRPASTVPCDTCGGFRLHPCTVCSGSKKSVHRNNFTLEFVALKCSACDESGLVACRECLDDS